MDIAIFTSGKISKIGINSGGSSKIFSFDSRILFQSPSSLQKRLHSLVRNLQDKSISYSDNLVLAIAGKSDSARKVMIQSFLLEHLSFSNSFNQFNFETYLSKLVNPNNIHLINDAECIAYGILKHLKGKLEHPSLVIFIDEGFGSAIIRSEVEVENFERAGTPIKSLGNNYPQYILCDQGLDELLIDNEKDIIQEYTKRFITIVNHFISKGKEEGLDFKNVIIHSSRVEFIQKEFAKAQFSNELIFIEQELLDEIKIDGALQYLWLKDLVDKKILKIEYWNFEGFKVYEFNNFNEFEEHWKSAKPIASDENYYMIYFDDDSVKKIPMGMIQTNEEIMSFEFK
jgi:hypothetical protein